jgi:hypothetical protein
VIADATNILTSTIYARLVETIGFKIFFLLWIARTLADGLREKPVEFARQLLLVLESQQRAGFRVIVTDNEP